MTWTFAEGNPFSTVTGNFDTMLVDVVQTIEHLPVLEAAKVIQCDARKFPFPRNSVLFTELPYYDNVGYADLSDYFYIWLRRCLKDTFPEMFDRVVSSKEELSSIPEHYEGVFVDRYVIMRYPGNGERRWCCALTMGEHLGCHRDHRLPGYCGLAGQDGDAE